MYTPDLVIILTIHSDLVIIFMRVNATVAISMNAKCERLRRSTRAVGEQLPIIFG